MDGWREEQSNQFVFYLDFWFVAPEGKEWRWKNEKNERCEWNKRAQQNQRVVKKKKERKNQIIRNRFKIDRLVDN